MIGVDTMFVNKINFWIRGLSAIANGNRLEAVILGADRKNRFLWERECDKNASNGSI